MGTNLTGKEKKGRRRKSYKTCGVMQARGSVIYPTRKVGPSASPGLPLQLLLLLLLLLDDWAGAAQAQVVHGVRRKGQRRAGARARAAVQGSLERGCAAVAGWPDSPCVHASTKFSLN